MLYWDHTRVLVYSCTLLHLLKHKDYQNYAIYFPNTHTHIHSELYIQEEPAAYCLCSCYVIYLARVYTHTYSNSNTQTHLCTHTFSRFIENVNIPLYPFILLNCVEFTQKYHLSHAYKHKVCWLAAHTCTPAVVLLVVSWHLFKIVCVCEFVCFDTELDPYDV